MILAVASGSAHADNFFIKWRLLRAYALYLTKVDNLPKWLLCPLPTSFNKKAISPMSSRLLPPTSMPVPHPGPALAATRYSREISDFIGQTALINAAIVQV
jgi:hypothetical protein